jgi:hypothetical protein
MALGDLSDWTPRFISVDERILGRILAVWPACILVLPENPPEDTITINLVHHLSNDDVVRRICHWVEYQFEPFGFDASGAAFSKGKIDMAIILDGERARYLAYECKRLNVTTKSGKATLATRYVTEGLHRFVSEQYAETLPVGGMLGYVLDGDCDAALTSVHAAIEADRVKVALIGSPVSIPAIGFAKRFGTIHSRGSEKPSIEVRHAALALPPKTSGSVRHRGRN